MTRGKVTLKLFAKESERRVSFRKRKAGLIKKLDEVTTLCDIDACAIISSPFDANMEVWPSHSGVHRVLSRFRNMAPTEQTKKMFNQETLTRERIQKLKDQLKKQRMENRRMEVDQIISQCLVGGPLDHQNNVELLNELDSVLGQNIQEINRRIQSLKGENNIQAIPTNDMQIGENSSSGNVTLENITNMESAMSNDGGGETIFSNVGAPRFV